MKLIHLSLFVSSLLLLGCPGIFGDIDLEFQEPDTSGVNQDEPDAEADAEADAESDPDVAEDVAEDVEEDVEEDVREEELWQLEFDPQIDTHNPVGVEFSVSLRVVDQTLDLVGEEVTLSLNQHSFADGSTEVTGTVLTTEGVQRVEFPDLLIYTPDDGYRLTAGGPGFEDVESLPFEMRCNSTDVDFHFGDGSSSSPYGICTIDDLYRLNDAEAGQHYVLVRPLELEEPHTPIGPGFGAILDGNELSISGIEISSSEEAVGFFSTIVEGGEVRNLHLEVLSLEVDSPIENGSYGGLAGQSSGVIEGCTAEVQINVEEGRVGGLVGFSNGSIGDSSTSGTVIGGRHTGGLVGESNVTISDSHSTADVSRTDVASVESPSLGGLVGFSRANLERSWSSGEVTSERAAHVGGLLGECRPAQGQISVVDSSSTSQVVATSERCGGLIGSSRCAVERSHATGDVTCDGQIAGGLIGTTDRRIVESHATGAVTIVCDEGCDETVAGGLVGVSQRDDDSFNPAGQLQIRSSSAEGTVSGARVSGGLVGVLGRPGDNPDFDILWCFSSGDVSGRLVAGGLAGRVSEFSRIEQSYTTSAVTVDASGTAGGVTGVSLNDDLFGAEIRTTYAASSVSCVDEGCTLQPLVGEGYRQDYVIDTYWDTDLAPGLGSPPGGLPTADFEDKESFAGPWDFDQVWIIPPEGEMDAPRRPRLRWENDEWAPD